MFFLNYFYSFYFRPCCIFIAARRLSPVVPSGAESPVAVHGLLMAVASLVVEYGL